MMLHVALSVNSKKQGLITLFYFMLLPVHDDGDGVILVS